MSHKRRHSKIQANAGPKSVPKPPAVLHPPPSPLQKWLFRLGGLLLPVLLLGLLELGLRVGGYGYDTDFFKVDRDSSGKTWLINNDQFTLRFFPPELARWPSQFRISLEKPSNVQRIFVLGESAAMGDPEPSVGASCYLVNLLRERFPGQAFEIVNLGITAINSHVILPIARDVAARGSGDIWLIYMGNNEMVGPFGAATVFGARAWPLSAARLNLAMQKTRVGQLVLQCLRSLGGKSKNAGWRGMKMFLQNQVPPDDPRRETVYRNFKSNLRDILQAGRQTGASIVLSTVSVNLRDCPPFGSMANTNLAAADRSRFDSVYPSAVALQTNHQWSEAAQKFQEAAGFAPEFAELQFRWAQCLFSESNTPAAREHFQSACNVDALQFRADSRINGILREAARNSQGSKFAFCDAESELAKASPSGIAGDESFFEHVHFNFDGNYRLARAWAESIAQVLPAEVRRNATATWASQEVCEHGLGLSDWNRMFVYTTIVGRMAQPPLATQLNNAARVEALQQQMAVVRQRLSRTNAVAEAYAMFQAALTKAPADIFLHENYANFLNSIGKKQDSLAEYLKVEALLPHDYSVALEGGRVLREAGRLGEAEPLLRQAVRMRPVLPDPWYELGMLLATKDDYAGALTCFAHASQIRPSDGDFLANKARALSRLNRHAEAIEGYREALKLQPESWETHFQLACELADANALDDATREYTEVIRLNPRHAVSHVNLGVLLFRQNRPDDAIEQFQIALTLAPDNAAAKDYLAKVTQWRDQKRKL